MMCQYFMLHVSAFLHVIIRPTYSLHMVIRKRCCSFKCQYLLNNCTDINESSVTEHARDWRFLTK